MQVKQDLGLFGLLHCGLLGDVEAVKELSDILALLDCDTRVHPHLPDELLSKEVTDLNKSASLSDGTVDGEMRIHSPHLVQVAIGESLEHVLDVTADSPHGSNLLLLTKPFLDLDGLGISHVDIDSQMLELLGEGAPLALHRDGPSLH